MTDTMLIWVHRLLRWGLGVLFIGVGVIYWKEDAWPAILFGSVMLVTGFFRPKRCLDDGTCRVGQE
jgi:hypothetical protein